MTSRYMPDTKSIRSGAGDTSLSHFSLVSDQSTINGGVGKKSIASSGKSYMKRGKETLKKVLRRRKSPKNKRGVPDSPTPGNTIDEELASYFARPTRSNHEMMFSTRYSASGTGSRQLERWIQEVNVAVGSTKWNQARNGVERYHVDAHPEFEAPNDYEGREETSTHRHFAGDRDIGMINRQMNEVNLDAQSSEGSFNTEHSPGLSSFSACSDLTSSCESRHQPKKRVAARYPPRKAKLSKSYSSGGSGTSVITESSILSPIDGQCCCL